MDCSVPGSSVHGVARVRHDLATKPPPPLKKGFPGGNSDKRPACQCRRPKVCGFDPWVGKIPWRRKWQPTSIFLSEESHGIVEPGRLQSMGSQGVGSD